MPEIYIEENGYYSIDCTAAVWSTNCIHDYYQDAGHKYGEIGFLKDTDFVIESDKAIYLVEYKNANVPGAAKPDAFRPEKDIILNKVAEKYFDTLHCLYLLGKNKPKKYIYVLEYPNGNSTSRLMIRNLLQKKLPFRLQAQLSAGKVRLIDEVKVVNIEEWNADPELCSLIVCALCNSRVTMYNNNYGLFPIFILGSLSGIVVVWVIADFMQKNMFLKWCGKNSIVIYVWQFVLTQFFKNVIEIIFNVTHVNSPDFIMTVCVFGVCVFAVIPIVIFSNRFVPELYGKKRVG